jgi:hypothetical protein
MPYKCETQHVKLPKDKDRRIKLTDEDRKVIIFLYYSDNPWLSYLAKKFWVSKRLIDFIVHPEKEKIVKEQYRIRRLDKRYYNKDKHREAVKNTRRHRQKVLVTNLKLWL